MTAVERIGVESLDDEVAVNLADHRRLETEVLDHGVDVFDGVNDDADDGDDADDAVPDNSGGNSGNGGGNGGGNGNGRGTTAKQRGYIRLQIQGAGPKAPPSLSFGSG